MHNINSSKGQAALEFLITYGWAIMIVLVAIGALTYVGLTNPSNLLPDKCTFGNGIVCQDSQITTRNVSVSVINGMGKTMYAVGAAPDGFNAICSPSITIPLATLTPSTPTKITCTFTVADRPQLGQTKKYKLKITYKKTTTGFTQTSFGEVYGKVQ